MIIQLGFVRFWRALNAGLAVLGHTPASNGEAHEAWAFGLDARGVARRRSGVGEP